MSAILHQSIMAAYPSAPPSYWEDVIALLPLNNSAANSKSGGPSFTFWTGAYTSVAKFGSHAFDPASNQGALIRANDEVAVRMGSSDFTLEGWCRRVGGNTGIWSIFGKYFTTGNQRSYEVSMQTLDGGATYNYIALFSTDGATATAITGGLATLNTWVHVALVRNAGTMTLYVDGVGSSASVSGSLFNAPDAYFTIGSRQNTGNTAANNAFIGQIDEVRVTKGRAIYTGNFTPPVAAFPNA